MSLKLLNLVSNIKKPPLVDVLQILDKKRMIQKLFFKYMKQRDTILRVDSKAGNRYLCIELFLPLFIPYFQSLFLRILTLFIYLFVIVGFDDL